MAWWNKIVNGAGSVLQPSLKFAFTMFDGDNSKKVAYRVKDVTLPSFQRNVDTVLLGSEMVRQEGTIQWQPIKISFYDTDLISAAGAEDSIALGLFNTGRMMHGQDLDFGLFNKDTFPNESKLSLVNTKNRYNSEAGKYTPSICFSEITIYKFFGSEVTRTLGQPMVDGSLQGIAFGQHAHVFTIQNPILTGINFGDLDYSSEESNLITIDIEYDRCEMKSEVYN